MTSRIHARSSAFAAALLVAALPAVSFAGGIFFDGSGSPEDDGFNVHLSPGTQGFIYDDPVVGTLHQVPLQAGGSNASLTLAQVTALATRATGWRLDVTIDVVSVSGAQHGSGFFDLFSSIIVANDDVGGVGVFALPTEFRVFDRSFSAWNTGAWQTISHGGGSRHLRIEVAPGATEALFYLDNMTTPVLTFAGMSPGISDSFAVGFGDASSNSQAEYYLDSFGFQSVLTPEPGSLPLAALGFAGMAAIRRRRVTRRRVARAATR